MIAELDAGGMVSLLPAALHPTNPSLAYFQAYRAPSLPWGEFTLFVARVGCRAGTRLRGFKRAASSTSRSPQSHSRNYGASPLTSPASASNRSVMLLLSRSSEVATYCSRTNLFLRNPQRARTFFVSASIILAGIAGNLKLVQDDTEFVFHKADRGVFRTVSIDGGALFHDAGRCLTWPISASFCRSDVTFDKIRYVLDPNGPAL